MIVPIQMILSSIDVRDPRRKEEDQVNFPNLN